MSVTLMGTRSLYNNNVSRCQHEMPDYVNDNTISGTSQLPEGVPGVNTMCQERKKIGKGRKEKERKMKQQTCMRSWSRPSPEGTRLLFAGETVSPIMCPADGQQKNDQNGQTNTAKMRAETKKVEKNKSRPQRGGGFSLNLDCLVIRGDLVCVISQGISRCIVTSCPVSCDITTYGISRYHIYIPNFWDGYGDIVVDLFLDIEHYLLPARCTKHGAPRVESKRNGYLAIELQKQ